MNVHNDYLSVTELAGDDVTREQVDRICHRYYWATNYCRCKDVLEVACGTGQGAGLLGSGAKTYQAGDYSVKILAIARSHYRERIKFLQFDAQNMPFPDRSLDVVVLFEALYYLPDAEKFVKECSRILRPGGKVLIATANKDLYDFNPSPYSYKYYGIIELKDLFHNFGFTTQFWGDTPISVLSLKQKVLRPVKKFVVSLGLMPKSMAGKKLLKKLVFGELLKMPAEIDVTTAKFVSPDALPSNKPCTTHKVIFCEAVLDT